MLLAFTGAAPGAFVMSSMMHGILMPVMGVPHSSLLRCTSLGPVLVLIFVSSLLRRCMRSLVLSMLFLRKRVVPL